MIQFKGEGSCMWSIHIELWSTRGMYHICDKVKREFNILAEEETYFSSVSPYVALAAVAKSRMFSL